MDIRIKFPSEALNFISELEGFEPMALYCSPGSYIAPTEWGRIRYEEHMIYFDIIPCNKKETKEINMEWISVKDRLPEINEKESYIEVLTWDGKRRRVLSCRGFYTFKMINGKEVCEMAEALFHSYPESNVYNVTHWMPLPELPEEKPVHTHILNVEKKIKCQGCGFVMIKFNGSARMDLTPPIEIMCRKCGKVHIFEVPITKGINNEMD